MRARKPLRSKYSHSVVSPSGYISKMGVDGTMSDTGPYIIERSRKSYVAGACMKVKSNLSIIEAVYAFFAAMGLLVCAFPLRTLEIYRDASACEGWGSNQPADVLAFAKGGEAASAD